MTKVLIIEAQMKQYRARFYALLHESLRADGIQLTVAYSEPSASEAAKKDTCELSPEYGLKVQGYWLWPDRLLYQPLLRLATSSDLLIVDQGNRFLLNHLLLPLSRLGLRRIAFWGHVENRKPRKIRISEWYRRKTLNWVTWWFAYTKENAKYLQEQGVPSSKITAVQNSVDTREIRDHVRSSTPQDRAALRSHLGIPVSAPVGIFCGALDKMKNLPFLIESGRIVKARIPAFHLILVGGGPEQEAVRCLVRNLPWIHLVGPRFGKEKAEFLAISDAFLLPGAAGLAILDAFAAGLPILTTRIGIHGPEIEYLEEDINGLMAEAHPGAYAEAVASLLSHSDRLVKLQAGAAASAEKYSIESMVENFRTGVQSCLGLSACRTRVAEPGPRKAEPASEISHNGHGFAITTSWDDGHPLDLRVAELLEKYGLRGTFYVPLENSRPMLSPAQIRDLSTRFEVGAHTVHHVVLTTLPKERARAEITESRSQVEEITGKPCSVFCFPSGRYSSAHLQMLSDAGFSGARTVELLSLDRPYGHNGLVLIPTTVQAYRHTAFTYFRNAAKRFRYKALWSLFGQKGSGDWAAAAIALLARARETGGVFHLWGHSWEIEEAGEWAALERVFAAMAEAGRCAPCVTNSELCSNGR